MLRENNEGLNRWLAGEGLMMDVEAAQKLIQRARLHLSSSLRAIGIFSDAKIDSLFSTVTSIRETNHASLNAISSKCDDNSVNSDSFLSDFAFTSHDFFMVSKFFQQKSRNLNNLTFFFFFLFFFLQDL
ncbi:unnamed protein product [Onchocerca flexuosa]|uniref:Uncharacterized protein n=1 Tax=Onchocerca flexuosa TaxID=387005 RepID=A0A183HN32_9BILA|nr:unnamed protein product [Onchocerca flexuosa]